MTVLVVGTPNASRHRHYARIRELADRIVLLQRAATWERRYVDVVVEADTSRLDACLEAARHIAKEEDITAVVTFVEHSVVAAAAIAEALSLPGLSMRAAVRARDKYQMRVAFRDAGLPCPPFGLARDLAEARRVCADVGFPLVLKPLIGGGSQHVHRVDDWAGVERLLPSLVDVSWATYDYDPLFEAYANSYGRAVLLEAYLPGTEVSVESVVHDGEVTTVAIHDKPWPLTGPTFEELYSATPSTHPPDVQERIRAATAAGIRALELDACATHTELRIDANGGEPMLLEIAGRLGGSAIYRSVLLSTGVDMLDAVVDMASGRPPTVAPSRDRPVGFVTVFANADGILERVTGLDEVTARSDVFEAEVYRRPGDRIVPPPLGSQSDAHIVFTAPDRPSLDATARELMDALTFEVRRE